MKKVVICGGHLTPALALIEELEKEKNVEIVFFGRKYSAEGAKIVSEEYKIIKAKNIKFVPISAGRLQRKFTRYTAQALAKTPIGFAQSLYLLRCEKPDIIVSFGGYISLPVVLAAKLLGIKCVTHEQSIIPGLATKINAKFCDQIFVSWQKTRDSLKNANVKLIGNLIRHDSYSKRASSANIQKFISSSKKLTLILGGNQGSHFINTLIFNSLENLKDYQILHQVGALNFKGDLDKAKALASNNYLPTPYLAGRNFGAALNSAHIVISRSGANTVWELATLSKVAILIPLPIAASGEQLANARVLEEAGSSVILNQNEATPELLLSKIRLIEDNFEKYQKNAHAKSRQMPQDAAKKLAEAVLGYT